MDRNLMKKHALKIENLFRTNSVSLFIGTGVELCDISEEITSLQWSAVFTTQTDTNIAYKFKNERRNPIVCVGDDRPEKLLDIVSTPIFFLNSKNNEETSTALKEIGLFDDEYEINSHYLDYINRATSDLQHMIVIGYDQASKYELPLKKLVICFNKIQNGNITFLGVDKEKEKQLVRFADSKDFTVIEEPLKEILLELPEDVYDDNEIDDGGAVYYRNGKAYTFSQSKLVKIEHNVELLSEKRVNGERPYGYRQFNTYFSRFMVDTPIKGPQWFGYHKSSQFFIKRDYMDSLLYLIRSMLKGNPLPNETDQVRPLVLEGAPASSKTVILGALAYQIFNEHEYPVLFIGKNFPDVNALNDILLTEIQGQEHTNILIFWDCSTHKNIIGKAVEIITRLRNLGRRFVLVCSSYEYHIDSTKPSSEEDVYYYKIVNNNGVNKWERGTIDDYQFRLVDDCFIVNADRKINDSEKKELQNKFREYSGLDGKTLNRMWNSLSVETDNDIFIYFYRLIAKLQENMLGDLKSEQKLVGDFVRAELAKKSNTNNETGSDTDELFKLSLFDGIDFSKLGFLENKKDVNDKEEIEYDLDGFNMCVAMFGQFKMPTPVSLAMHILMDNYVADNTVYYSTENRKVFNVITTKVPWIYYSRENETNDFCFQYRNSLEAEKYISDLSDSVEKQLKCIIQFLDYYQKEYQKSGDVDLRLKNSIIDLLRYIGFNSDVLSFEESGNRYTEHQELLSKFDRIIDKMHEIRNNGVPDVDGRFTLQEVTLIREYYKDCKKDDPLLRTYSSDAAMEKGKEYRKAITELMNASSVANKTRLDLNDRLNKSRYSKDSKLINIRNSLLNEMIQANNDTKEIINRVDILASYYPVVLELFDDIDRSKLLLDFEVMFELLYQAIKSEPRNGYYYNTIMKLFINSVDNKTLSEDKKILFLTRIQELLEYAETSEFAIERRGRYRDEFTSNRLLIENVAKDNRITINRFDNETEELASFIHLYNELLDQDNPAAILLICRNELSNASIDYDSRVLNDSQRETCKKVVAFLNRPEHIECVNRNAASCYLLLRVYWMWKSGYTFSNNTQFKRVGLDAKEWRTINNYCVNYYEKRDYFENPSVRLLYALSELELTGNLREAQIIISKVRDSAFYSSGRMRTPFLYCHSDGTPVLFNGFIKNIDENWIHLDSDENGKPISFDASYSLKGIGERKEKEIVKNTIYNDLIIALGHTGLRAVRNEGVQQILREDRR